MGDLARMDATAQADLVRRGEASPEELVEAAIRRIEETNPQLNAVITPLFDEAREAARGELPDGPFRGVPMVLKDLGAHSAGHPFHEGMAFLRDIGWTESYDTELAARFRRAGFVFCGKTNTPELGIVATTEPVAFGATRNPWDTDRSPGGSSGGSGAAVAAGMVPIGHANDGGGSIRIPASACGLVGLKPSRARVPMAPDFGDMYGGMVAELCVSRSVRDTAAVLDAVAGPAPGDPYAAPAGPASWLEALERTPGRLRIGIRTDPPGRQFEAHPDCVTAAREAAKLLESLGHEVVESAPDALDDEQYVPTFLLRWTAGIAWVIGYWERRTGRSIGPDDVEPLTWAMAEQGRSHSAADYLAAVEYHQLVSRRVARWWHEERFDLLLTPTMAEPPVPLGEIDTADRENPLAAIVRSTPPAIFTAGFNVTGQPAISLPLHQSAEGLPIGVQLVGDHGREDLLLQVAAQLEEASPWAERTPRVFAGSERSPAR